MPGKRSFFGFWQSGVDALVRCLVSLQLSGYRFHHEPRFVHVSRCGLLIQ